MSEKITHEIAAQPKGAAGWLVFTILAITGLGYAFAVFNAIAFLVELAPLGLSGYGWFVLLFAIVFPLIVLAVVYAIGRRRSGLELLAISLAGLGVTAVFWLNVLAHYVAALPLFGA